ncbi:uncharacterized protein SPAPADRAFT_135780 [Spathaspora passalidarum NRRL Y-27907]|uniref:DUF676 domain-containing protein n=1 Tax=Spathaspora passalidarum (strain NRRL Y-27907 / 11-Y1) TaxID=619300 RepID=G3ALY7_SPAPN|nr:uncharacterized protein SPAPADRAFT_135780 [Spathaspora passalidarum NRRL Y-27907]EGW33340.1 hypothetical protein SPAPADRAFT_135780 [Spathaspora passalidarum NRRL Y-27907]
MTNFHLVILVHGLWGNPHQLSYIERQLKENIGTNGETEELWVYKTGSHQGYLTYDGIDINGKRISDEIREITTSIQISGDNVVKFSIIGYSLGGLIARYALGILYANDYFEDITPVNFVTFCSPHVGVLNPLPNSRSAKLYNSYAPLFLAITGGQLFLKDQIREIGKPLLVWMADPKSIFYKSLTLFKYRSLYSNVVNDRRTSWFTSAISFTDPVNSLVNHSASKIHASYIKGYAPTVIDIAKPFYYHDMREENTGGRSFWFIIRWFKVFLDVVLFTPIWTISFFVTSIQQRIKLNRRVREFFNDASNNLFLLYESIDDEGDADNDCGDNESTLSDMGHEIMEKIQDTRDTFLEDVYTASNDDINSHALALNEDQKFIIDKLNKVGWDKFPIILRQTKATHAASIVRQDDPKFAEGKVVISHFINEIFQVD